LQASVEGLRDGHIAADIINSGWAGGRYGPAVSMDVPT